MPPRSRGRNKTIALINYVLYWLYSRNNCFIRQKRVCDTLNIATSIDYKDHLALLVSIGYYIQNREKKTVQKFNLAKSKDLIGYEKVSLPAGGAGPRSIKVSRLLAYLSCIFLVCLCI